MPPNEEDVLGARLSRDLGVFVRVSIANRRRAALEPLLRWLGRDPDTTSLVFPDPLLSLTHSGGIVVALALSEPAIGVGVDFEAARNVPEQAARFFLTGDEQRFVLGLCPAARARHLLRLWTVKEALFKANPDNAGTMLADYVTADPEATVGFGGPASRRPCVYASVEALGGILTAAFDHGAPR